MEEVLKKKLRPGNEGLVGKKCGVLDEKVTNHQIKGNNGRRTRSDPDEPLRDI
ncbi:14773_t:CDS:2 [Gigaspora rosea]|nr:14773_t:CDS:2 [Gigaspora rosea]